MASREYEDLFEVIGHDVDMTDFCGSNGTYLNWEKNVAAPELRKRGYSVDGWLMGERDSFGPLSRIVVATKDGIEHRLIYG